MAAIITNPRNAGLPTLFVVYPRRGAAGEGIS